MVQFTMWLERMKKSGDVTSYVALLETVPAKELASAFSLPEVHSRTTIMDVLRAFKTDRNVLVRESAANYASSVGECPFHRPVGIPRSGSKLTHELPSGGGHLLRTGSGGMKDKDSTVILARAAFFEAALMADSVLDHVGKIVDSIPSVGQ